MQVDRIVDARELDNDFAKFDSGFPGGAEQGVSQRPCRSGQDRDVHNGAALHRACDMRREDAALMKWIAKRHRRSKKNNIWSILTEKIGSQWNEVFGGIELPHIEYAVSIARIQSVRYRDRPDEMR